MRLSSSAAATVFLCYSKPPPLVRVATATRVRLSASPREDAWIAGLLADDVLQQERWEAALEVVNDEEAMLTYGEFDVHNFQLSLDAVLSASGRCTSEMVFCDIGSGGGRLVLAAAARYHWKRCLGVEILPTLNALAIQTYDAAVQLGRAQQAPLSECRFVELDLTAADARTVLADVDVAFAFSTCFDDELFSTALRRALPLGALVVTIDAMLPNRELDQEEEEDDDDDEGDHGSEAEPLGFFVLRRTLCSAGTNAELVGVVEPVTVQGAGDPEDEGDEGELTHSAPFTAYVWELCGQRPAVSVDYGLLRAPGA